jgi:3-oxoadipate enol-lactonase
VTLLDPNSIVLHRSGSGSGAPLVLLHCLGVDHKFWSFMSPMADGFTLLNYDLPGHGATPVPAVGYSIADLSAQLAGILRHHNIRRAHVAGISLARFQAEWNPVSRPESALTCNKLERVRTQNRFPLLLNAL